MSILVAVYTEIIYRPLLNGLAFFYSALPYHDIGLAAFLLVVTVRLLLHRSIVQSTRAQYIMPELQTKLKEIQAKFRDRKEEQAKATMSLYRSYGMHPFSFLTPLLVQIPVFLGIYQVFSQGIAVNDPSLIYPFLPAIDAFNPIAFGLINFTEPNVLMAVAAGVSQFLQTYWAPRPPQMPGTATDDFGRMMRWQGMYVIPVVFTVIAMRLPSAIAFSWTAFNLVAIVQQTWIHRRLAYERNSRSRASGTDSQHHGDSRGH